MFNVHGEWKISVDNQVLLQWFSGSWNEEAIIAYAKEFKIMATPLVGSKWAILSVFEDWELGVPEIEKHVIEHCQWFKDNGCIKECHIYSADAAKEMQLEKLIPHTEEGYERCVFTHFDDAVSWLESHQYQLQNTQFLKRLKAGTINRF